MGQTGDGVIFTRGFWTLCIGVVLGPLFVLGSTLLVMAWVKAATYDGVSASNVHDLLVWGFWLAVISLSGSVAVAIWRVDDRRNRARRNIHAA
jgi:hypothetical protein